MEHINADKKKKKKVYAALKNIKLFPQCLHKKDCPDCSLALPHFTFQKHS